jgi:hypothetical protein
MQMSNRGMENNSNLRRSTRKRNKGENMGRQGDCYRTIAGRNPGEMQFSLTFLGRTGL